jgi:hypothetical protein
MPKAACAWFGRSRSRCTRTGWKRTATSTWTTCASTRRRPCAWPPDQKQPPCGQRSALPTRAHHRRNHDRICRTIWTQLSVIEQTAAKSMFAASELPSASLASRDILFPALAAGRNGAERGPSRSFIRTTVTRSEAYFGPFPVSLRPLSLTQPNHAHFGTVIGTSTSMV